jgi:S-adenosylmethionine synthetase
MLKNYHLVEQYEHEFAKNNPQSIEQKFALLDALYKEAKMFGHFSGNNIMHNIDEKITLAKILNTNVSSRTR